MTGSQPDRPGARVQGRSVIAVASDRCPTRYELREVSCIPQAHLISADDALPGSHGDELVADEEEERDVRKAKVVLMTSVVAAAALAAAPLALAEQRTFRGKLGAITVDNLRVVRRLAARSSGHEEAPAPATASFDRPAG